MDYLEMVRQRDELNKQITEKRREAFQEWFNKQVSEAAEQGFTTHEVVTAWKRKLPRK